MTNSKFSQIIITLPKCNTSLKIKTTLHITPNVFHYVTHYISYWLAHLIICIQLILWANFNDYYYF